MSYNENACEIEKQIEKAKSFSNKDTVLMGYIALFLCDIAHSLKDISTTWSKQEYETQKGEIKVSLPSVAEVVEKNIK